MWPGDRLPAVSSWANIYHLNYFQGREGEEKSVLSVVSLLWHAERSDAAVNEKMCKSKEDRQNYNLLAQMKKKNL